MHGPSLATLIVAASLSMGLAGTSMAGTSDVIEQARQRLLERDGIAAASILEAALPTAGPNKEAVLDLLRQAYEVASKQAEAAGKPREAETYRENLRILNRKAKAATTLPSPPPPRPEPIAKPPSPATTPSIPPIALPDSPSPSAEASAAPEPEPSTGLPRAPADPSDSPDVSTQAPKVVETPKGDPLALLPLPAQVPQPTVRDADAAFALEHYKEAGAIYGVLAREKLLPNNRREHWAYCRSVVVAERINAHPASNVEWTSIEAEIDQIRRLDPDNWLGEYLRNKATSLRAAGRGTSSGKSVIRANSPDEPLPGDRPVKASNVPAGDTSRPAGPLGSRDLNGGSRIGTMSGRWQVKETANFKVYHADPALAEKVAQVAEATRREQSKRWSNALPQRPWQPLCEIYLYPTAAQYAQMTGQPEDSPGFSTMGMNEGRIISRRVNLRADHPTLLPAVLPHEVTHVILADLFTMQQIPRWADEGMAVLSEPLEEQRRRASDLSEPLGKNVVFPIAKLMSMDYPDPRYWSLYYAQSVSLTRFLVEQGTPAQLVEFLQGAQKAGFENELRRVYQINGYPDLEARWVAYARKMAGPAQPGTSTASNASADVKAR